MDVMTTLLVAFLAALAASGVLLAVYTLRGFALPTFQVGSDQFVGKQAVAFALVAFCLVFFLSKLVSLSLAAAAVSYLIPLLYQEKKSQERVTEKMEAIAAFAQALADSVGGGNSISAAIAIAAQNPPAAIAGPLRTFRSRLRSEGFETSVRALVEDLDSPAGDILGAHLLQANSFSVGNLTRAIRRVSATLHDYILTNKKIVTSRRKQEFEIKGLTLILLAMIVFLFILSPSMLDVYSRDVLGELKLMSVFMLAAGGWLVANRLTQRTDQGQFMLKERR